MLADTNASCPWPANALAPTGEPAAVLVGVAIAIPVGVSVEVPLVAGVPTGAVTDTLTSAEAVAAGAPCAQAAMPATTASAANEAISLLIMLFGRHRRRLGCSAG